MSEVHPVPPSCRRTEQSLRWEGFVERKTVNALLDSESSTGGERGWTKVCCEKSFVFLTGPACRAGLAPDGDVSTDGWGALDSFSMAVSWAFPLLPRPRDSARQGFSNKIIHTVFSMLVSNHHHRPTSLPSHPSLPGSMCATCTALFNNKTSFFVFV